MSRPLIPEKVERIAEYKPNTDPCRIRLDANESPFLPSDTVMAEFTEALKTLDFNRYPDPYATELVKAFADVYGVDPAHVTAGNGSDELISLIGSGLTEPGDRVLVSMPDFSMYEFYASLAGAEIISVPKDAELCVDIDAMIAKARESGAKLILFSNPCNPTGQLIARSDVIRLIEATDAIVVADEAYMEFAPKSQSVMDLVGKYENLIVLKTLSKAFGSAALRLGFAVAGGKISTALRKIKSPYNVNTVSQVLGRIVLAHADEIREKAAILRDNAAYLHEKLTAMHAPAIEKIYPTATNFVYFKLTSPEKAASAAAALKERSIAIRCMSGAGCLRISAGTRAELDEMLPILEEELQ